MKTKILVLIIITMKNEINEAHEAVDENSSFDSKRKIVVPGEVIVKGEDYLPGEGTHRDGENIVASKFGLAEEAGRVVKLIPIFGAFIPKLPKIVSTSSCE